MSTLEFDSTYSAITGQHVGGIYIPSVEDDGAFDADGYDVLIDGMPDNLSTGWRALKGYTSQHGYRGCIMHPSETMSDDAIREAVRDAGGDVFAIVAVENGEYGDDYEPDAVGWAVIYRSADACPSAPHAHRHNVYARPEERP
ncbi:hypothetical protein [Streptomyces sp. AC495_CC817]|uniref:hypothetical protein n=1 Tax=Streptomyces sp. AC495_CC817 TaxID=2823900 RepID=UPI001C26A6B7|nr:hypothetical protein [Streptomyces sp. AC495_CC817]